MSITKLYTYRWEQKGSFDEQHYAGNFICKFENKFACGVVIQHNDKLHIRHAIQITKERYDIMHNALCNYSTVDISLAEVLNQVNNEND